jgi:hypothetical protein
MIRTSHILIIVGVLINIMGRTFAQTFSYQLTSTSVEYSPLSEPTFISNGSDWTNQRFKISVGFNFNFLGQNFDSLYIETNGFIVFDKKRNYSIATFKGANCKKDTNDTYSSMSYILSGNNGNKVLKIQFNNIGFVDHDPTELFSYQIWLYEQSGTVEFHTGPNNNQLYLEDGKPTLLGLINANQDTETKAFLATGNPASPSGTSQVQNNGLSYLSTIPEEGRTFIFSPNN